MKKSLKLIAGVLSALIIITATSCAKSESETTNKPGAEQNNNSIEKTDTKEEAKKNVEIRVSWWGSDNRHDAMNEVAKLYMSKNSNVTVTTEYAAFDGWQQKLLTQLSGKTEPDVMQVNYNWVHSFGKGKNVFYNLNDLNDKIDLSNWSETDLGAMTVNGELAAVPHGTTARANLYNTALFKEYGLEYPKTYNDIIAAGKIIGKDNTPTGAENKYVQANIGEVSTDLYIAQMLYNKTGKVMQSDGKVNYSIDDVAKIFDIYKSFEDAGAFPTFAQEDPIQNESNPVWTSGRIGSVYEWVGTMDKYLASYKGGEAKDEISVAPYITETEGQKIQVFAKPSLGYSISKNSKNPDVAADYINFMFTDPDAIRALGTSLGVSSNKATREIQDGDGFVKGAMKLGYELLNNYDQVILDPYFEDENVRGQRYTAIQKFRSGKASSSEAAKDYIEKQQAELDKLYK